MRLMLPREHGVYGQLLFPLATALLVGRPTVPAFALVATGVFAFLAHEPLLVVFRRRGLRASREHNRRAWRLLIQRVVLSLLAATIAIARMPSEWRLTLFAPVVFAGGVGVIIALNCERTIGGEMLTASTFSSLAFPTALAAGSTFDAAITCTAAFAASFAAATASVRTIITSTRQPPATRARVIAGTSVLLSLALLVVLAQVGLMRVVGVWAVLPSCGAALAFVMWPPRAIHLRTVGWTLVIGSSSTAVVLVSGLR